MQIFVYFLKINLKINSNALKFHKFSKEFDLDELIFYQYPKGYRYNSVSVMFYDFVKGLKLKNAVLEVGAGCGIIGLLLKNHNKSLNLSLLDILEQNCKLIRLNAEQNRLDVSVICADFKTYKSKQKFDFIISNPPFYREEAVKSKHFQDFTSKASSNLPLESLIISASANLSARGKLIFCYESFSLDTLCALLLKYKLKLEKLRFIHKDKTAPAKLAFIVAAKSSKAMCEVLTPCFLYEGAQKSAYLRSVYEGLNIKSVDVEEDLNSLSNLKNLNLTKNLKENLKNLESLKL